MPRLDDGLRPQEVMIRHCEEQQRCDVAISSDLTRNQPHQRLKQLLQTPGPHLMAILNITPDSFSDGGTMSSIDDVLNRAQVAINDGAAILDVGGESTRPGAKEISASEECRRVLAVIQALVREFPETPISIDTRKASVAQAALDAGAIMVNDVSGLQFEPKMSQVVKQHQAFLCLMHSQGVPKTMQEHPTYSDVVTEVLDFLTQQVTIAEAIGIPNQHLIIDPGFGFGKTLEHNQALLQHLKTFTFLGLPLLLGLSRKSFLTGGDTSIRPNQRDGLSVQAMEQALMTLSPILPVIFRVHNVAIHAKVFGQIV